MLDAFFSGYWNEFIKANLNASEEQVQTSMAKTVNSYSVRPEDILPKDDEKIDAMSVLSVFLHLRLSSMIGDSSSEFVSKSSDARLAHNDFNNNDARFENSLKFLPIWAEAFVITSIAFTFGPIFTKRARRELSEALKKRILECKSDFGTYQKLKKKAGAGG